MNIMDILQPIILAVVAAVAGLIGTYGAKFLKKGIDWLQSKIGVGQFQAAKEIAVGLYVYLEDKYNLSGMGEEKRKEMEILLLEKFPKLTQVELDAINKEVWLAFNQEWLDDKSKSTETDTKRIDG